MTVIALPQTSTIHRPPTTVDHRRAETKSGPLIQLADLVDAASDVTFCYPDEIGPCEDCVRSRAVAVATVSWPDPDEAEGRDEITVCRDCLRRAVNAAATRCAFDDRIAVEVPAWTLDDLAAALGVPAWEIARWGLLVTEEGDRFLADELAHARRLLNLGRAGVSLTAADKLLRRYPATALAVETALGVAA